MKGQPSINRNILECKVITAVLISFFAFVLIETYWNVKEYCPTMTRKAYIVLIETYWNVK